MATATAPAPAEFIGLGKTMPPEKEVLPNPMEMEKGMFEELLLVCQFVGTRRAAGDDDDAGASPDAEFLRGEDCLVSGRRL
jgi:hypothetical protein